MPNQKRVFIIHSWTASPSSDWLPWLAKNLTEKRFSVEAPEMPDTDNPKIGAWTEKLKKVIGTCDENTFFVCHSIGCQTIMRYLEKIDDREKCGGAVFIAPWTTLTGIDDHEDRMTTSPWLNLPIDFEKVKKKLGKVICVFSDNDPFVPAENWEIFSKKLGAETIIEKKKGHFVADDGVLELPAAFEAVLKIAEDEKKESRNE